MRPLVLDTNVVLDLYVFRDPRTLPLQECLVAPSADWITTAAMRSELEHVLVYPNLAKRVPDPQAVLAKFDAHSRLVDAASPCKVTCRDEDDQKFIDLAVAHAAVLISKDKEVLRLRKKLAPLGIEVRAAY